MSKLNNPVPGKDPLSFRQRELAERDRAQRQLERIQRDREDQLARQHEERRLQALQDEIKRRREEAWRKADYDAGRQDGAAGLRPRSPASDYTRGHRDGQALRPLNLRQRWK